MSYERRKVRVGKVVSDKMDKTCIVEVEWRSVHRIYKKAVRRRTRFNAHDENNTAQFGDLVTIIESRPTSKTKKWRLGEIVQRDEIAEVQPEEITVTGEVGIVIPEPTVPEVVEAEPVEESAAVGCREFGGEAHETGSLLDDGCRGGVEFFHVLLESAAEVVTDPDPVEPVCLA